MTMDHLDKLWKQAVLAVYGEHCLCGKRATQIHHRHHRSNKAVRWAISNGVPICASCHRILHDGNLLLNRKLFESRGPQWAIALDIRRRNNDPWKPQADKIAEDLRAAIHHTKQYQKENTVCLGLARSMQPKSGTVRGS